MQAANIWNKLHLHRAKVIILLLCVSGQMTLAQTINPGSINRPESDSKPLKYGFFLGFHQNSFNLQYSDLFESAAYDDLQSITTLKRPGFNLGFMLNFRIKDQLTLRVVPVKIALYQYAVDYNYINQPTQTELVESTRVEPGMFLKYRSIRRGNTRMYVIGGLTASIRSGKSDEDISVVRINTRKLDLKAEVGFGTELYLKYFKFAPELRYSAGLLNALNGDSNFLVDGLQRISTHIFSLYLHFSD